MRKFYSSDQLATPYLLKNLKRGILFVLIFGLMQSAFAQGPVGPWQYSRQINLNTTTTLEDYQVKVTLTATELGSPYSNIKVDGSDLRFYDGSNNECSYWIEKWDRNGTSIVWVKMQAIGSLITMYYGNASATAASNATSTFDWYEGFEGTSLNTARWATTTSGGTVVIGGGNATLSNTNGGRVFLSLKIPGYTTASTDYILESKFSSPNDYKRNRFYASNQSSPLDGTNIYYPLGFDNGYFDNKVFYKVSKGTSTVSKNQDYITQWELADNTTYNWKTLNYPDYSILDANSGNFNKLIRYITIGVTENSGTSLVVDWVRVRKRQLTDPVTTIGTQSSISPVITSVGSPSCQFSTIVINGSYLSGATAENVKIGGVPVTSITSNNGSQIVATIPVELTGTVTVTTRGLTATSLQPFSNEGIRAYIYNVTGGGGYCSGSDGVVVGVEKSQTGVSYELFRDGTPVSPAQSVPGTGAAISFDNQTIAGTYTVQAQLISCTEMMDGNAVVVINPLPAEIRITPSTSTVCQEIIVPLTASLKTGSVETKTVQTTTNPKTAIPDNDASGTSQLMNFTGVPAGATITGIKVLFRVTHPNVGDLVINLKGPNGNVLNITNRIGGSGDNFGIPGNTNTVIDNTSTNNITTGSAPFTSGPYSAQADGGVAGATKVSGNISNTATLSGLYNTTANGYWIMSVRDEANGNTGTFDYFRIEVTYTVVSNLESVTWSPSSDLYTDPGATIPYTGESVSKVYAKPTVSGTLIYKAFSTNTLGCSAIDSTKLIVDPSPVLTISGNYCNYPGVVRITAKSDIPISNWVWSNGTAGGTPNNSNDTSYIDVNVAGTYFVSAKAAGNSCAVTAQMSVAQELAINGDFEQGNVGFESEYYYQEDVAGNTELLDDTNPVNNGYGIGTNGRNYHENFWGVDHTFGTGSGNFMIVNGHGDLVIWKNRHITVLPNTTYYFSGFGMSLNDEGPFARLKFNIEGDGTYNDNFTAILNPGIKGNSNNGWQKFYGNWTSGPTTTSVNLSIINEEGALGGNDFGLDDLSFGTLSAFFNLASNESSHNQIGVCEGTPIEDIIYEVGGDGKAPKLTSGTLPEGLSEYWNGRTFRISGTPTTAGNYQFAYTTSGCNVKTNEVTINVIPASNAGTFTDGPLISSCYGTGGAIALTGSVGSLQWQNSDDKVNWSNVPDGNYSNLQSTTYYRVIAQNTQGCPKDTSEIIKVGVKNLWVGKTGTDWNSIDNWSDESIPDNSCDDVIIPQVEKDRYPVLTANTTSVKNIIIQSNATTTVNNTAIFQVSGSISSSGGLDATDGTIEMNGAAAQSISSRMFKDTTIKNLIVSNDAGLQVQHTDSSLAITGKISFGSTSGKLNSGDNITLKSTKEATASLGAVGSNNQVTGKFTVERYINVGTGLGEHGKKWLFLATPTEGQSIKESWMEGGGANEPEGYGIMLSGSSGGWDRYSPAPSIKYHNPATNLWIGALGSTADLYNPAGWMTFIRGDRSVKTDADPLKNTTLRSKGTLKTGEQTFTLYLDPDAFTSIGNPYASAIDMTKVNVPNNKFTVWNPNLGGDYSYGAYQTYTLLDGHYLITPSLDESNDYIQSGQAFFVENDESTLEVVIDEDAKADTSNSTEYFRQIQSARRVSTLRTNLFNGDVLMDGTFQQFADDFDNNVDQKDARKMTNSGINLAVKVGSNLLIVERKQTINHADTIFFNLTGTATGKYQFDFNATNLSAPGLEAWLEDAFTSQRTPLNLDGSTEINFDVTGAAASKASGRFRIVFKAARPLPVTFVKVAAEKDGGNVNVKWTVAQEINLDKYVVMSSTDGSNFTDKISVKATGGNGYTTVDKNAVDGYNYYRIRSVDKDGTASYSDIVKVFMGSANPSITVFPNPIVNGNVNLKLANMPPGKYQVRLLNPGGQVVLTREWTQVGSNHTERIPWDYKMAHGSYQLEVKQPDGITKVIVVMY